MKIFSCVTILDFCYILIILKIILDSDLTINGRYVRPQQYQIASGSHGAPYGTPSALSPSYSEYPSGGGGGAASGGATGGSSYTPNYGGMTTRPSFTPVSTPQPGSSNPSFSR